ncbi:MAG: Xylose isomerase [candidate division BRC1 bacterium ADurb.BinA364]|nr:MAG: Xylose isomerase [candidate division BRC1 bacterium ADurb.BinA364]
MNKLAVITAFLAGVRNRYMQYKPDETLRAKLEAASKVKGLDGLELCYPMDFEDFGELKAMLDGFGFGVSAVNVRSRRTGKWLRGAFSSASAAERREVADEFRLAIDRALELGATRITTCPLNDGTDYVFEMNYFDAYRYAEETFAAICRHNPAVKVCIEYKWNDPRCRSLFGTAGETLAFCQSVGAENLGATLDFGHSIQAGERPAQSVALLSRANRLFYVHLNDNDRQWDWDMIPGAFNFWDMIEFLYYLREAGYTDDWFAYDVMSKEVDTVEHFSAVAKITRRLEALAGRLDRSAVEPLLRERNPAKSLEFLYDTVLG